MKERHVRQRIEGFLKRTARDVVLPASLGIGLTLAGCTRTGMTIAALLPKDAGVDPSSRDAAGIAAPADASVDVASPGRDTRQIDLPDNVSTDAARDMPASQPPFLFPPPPPPDAPPLAPEPPSPPPKSPPPPPKVPPPPPTPPPPYLPPPSPS